MRRRWRSVVHGMRPTGRRLRASAFFPEALEARVLLSANFPLSTDSWTALGPAPIINGQTAGNTPVTGRLTAIAADPTDANTIYVASAGGGAWKTKDGGTTWAPLTDGQATLSMGAIAIDP